MSREWFFMRKMADRLRNTVKLSERGFWLLFLIILIVAWLLRFYDLSNLPCGLAPDEADVARVASEGKFQAVYDNPYNEAEGFFVSWLILVFRALGQGVWQVFSASAFLGWVTVFVAGLAARKHFGKFVALFASSFLATSTWHLGLSQSGTRQVTTPFFLALSLLFFPRSKNDKTVKEIEYFLFGMIFGLGFYGYLAYRAMLLVLLIAVVILAVKLSSGRKYTFLRFSMRVIILFAAGFTLSILPLLSGYSRHPHTILSRSAQVSIFDMDVWRTVKQFFINIVLVMRGFFVQGSANWHQNLDSRAFIPWYLAPLLFVGIYWSIQQFSRYLKNKKAKLLPALLLPSALVFLIPDLLTDATPHGARLSGEIIIFSLLIAVGFQMLLFRLVGLEKRMVISSSLLVFFLISTASLSFNTLQERHRSQTYAKDYFCEMRDVGEYLKVRRRVHMASGAFGGTIWIIGSWYDFSPLNFYLKDDPILSTMGGIRNVDYEEIISGFQFSTGDTIIVPAYTTSGYYRLHTWFVDQSTAQRDDSLVNIMKLHNPQLKEVYSHLGSNPSWFPGRISFKVFALH